MFIQSEHRESLGSRPQSNDIRVGMLGIRRKSADLLALRKCIGKTAWVCRLESPADEGRVDPRVGDHDLPLVVAVEFGRYFQQGLATEIQLALEPAQLMFQIPYLLAAYRVFRQT